MSNVEDKIKELLEASMQEATAPGGKGVAAEPMKKSMPMLMALKMLVLLYHQTIRMVLLK